MERRAFSSYMSAHYNRREKHTPPPPQPPPLNTHSGPIHYHYHYDAQRNDSGNPFAPLLAIVVNVGFVALILYWCWPGFRRRVQAWWASLDNAPVAPVAQAAGATHPVARPAPVARGELDSSVFGDHIERAVQAALKRREAEKE